MWQTSGLFEGKKNSIVMKHMIYIVIPVKTLLLETGTPEWHKDIFHIVNLLY